MTTSIFPFVFPSAFMSIPSGDVIGKGHMFESRCIIETKDGDLYYPLIEDCTTNKEYPFAAQTATVSLTTASDEYKEHLAPLDRIILSVFKWLRKHQPINPHHGKICLKVE